MSNATVFESEYIAACCVPWLGPEPRIPDNNLHTRITQICKVVKCILCTPVILLDSESKRYVNGYSNIVASPVSSRVFLRNGISIVPPVPANCCFSSPPASPDLEEAVARLRLLR